LPNPNGARGQSRPAQHDSDGQWELGWAFEHARIGRHECARWQRNDRRYRKAVRVGTARTRQNAREVMVQGAALIVGIDGAMVVMAIALVDVVVVDVIGDAGVGDVVRNVLLARHDMLEMDTDQRHDAGELGNQKKPQKPAAKSAPDARRCHLIRLVTAQRYQ
jgi:hypothetical protein